MLHMMKLAVGIRDIAHLRELQAGRLAADGGLRHLTRSFPRRAAEIIDGGSMYWVIAGAMVVRQRIPGIEAASYDDGSACAAIHLDPDLVPVAGRPVRPFQGWRYLAAEAAPPDIAAGEAVGGTAGGAAPGVAGARPALTISLAPTPVVVQIISGEYQVLLALTVNFHISRSPL